MRFTKLVVESFQAIQRAEVEFGPSLNVLYGPNDLGKSTLATAMRAALLVMPTSSEAGQYSPWYADATPRVALTFVDDAGCYWKVSKGFGSGTGAGAELLYSKDGRTFALDCKARQVDEKIRTLLAWGIPAPGGKGAPRGLPTSFLAKALLAAQTDVDTILGESLADDDDGSGKLRLTKALAALAQDPEFKRVLDAAQREVDACFAPKGARKRGQGSRFAQAANDVKKLHDELTLFQRQLSESSAIEESVNSLRELRTGAVVRREEMSAALIALEGRLANARKREEAQASLALAQVALSEITAHAERVTEVAAEVGRLTEGEAAKINDVRIALDASEVAATALRAADESHRAATSEDGARQRELRRAQLAEQVAGLSMRRQAADARKSKANTSLKARRSAESARDAVRTARVDLEKKNGELIKLREQVKDAEAEVEIARAVVAYGRWRAAASAEEEARSAKASAVKGRADAEGKDAEASSLEMRARTIDAELAAKDAVLATEAQVSVLEELGRALEVAEAALGGGITVAMRPRAGVAVRALVDQKEILNEGSLSTERVLEAERSVVISIGELVEVEITAGAADKRRTVESLRARWKVEAGPLLERAGVKSVRELAAAITAVTKGRTGAAELRGAAERLRAEAKSLRGQAALHEEQAAKLNVSVEELDARKAAIGPTDAHTLETRLAKLGKSWELQGEATQAARAKDLKALQTQVDVVAQAKNLAEYRVSEADNRAEEQGAAYEHTLTSLESPDPEAVLQRAEVELQSISRSDAESAAQLAALEALAGSEVERAAQAVDEAQGRLRAAKEAHDRAVLELEGVRADLHALRGQHRELNSQLEAMDRSSAEEVLQQRERELAALPEGPSVSREVLEAAKQELAKANRDLEDAKEELHKSEGALSKVGGAAVREEVGRVEEALAGARIRQKEIEVDADAWKLLLETLRTVENEEGAHLGRALAGPVTTRFVELTGGRYKGLRLDAALKVEAVDPGAVATGQDVLGALSVGTRDQLATLIRVTIADQLRTAIVLDDHLVHTDPVRLAWFRDVLLKTALNTQVIVLTCRPEDYLTKEELPTDEATRDLAGGTVRAIDVARLMTRWTVAPSRPAPARLPDFDAPT